MTDLEISKALALAIGYLPGFVWKTASQGVLVFRVDGGKTKVDGLWQHGWRPFDYRDWNVIGPIAERYKAFPFYDQIRKQWTTWQGTPASADTPQKAIALAVIGGTK